MKLETKVILQKKPNEKVIHPNDVNLDLSDINKYYIYIVKVAIRIINLCISLLMCVYGSPGIGKTQYVVKFIITDYMNHGMSNKLITYNGISTVEENRKTIYSFFFFFIVRQEEKMDNA